MGKKLAIIGGRASIYEGRALAHSAFGKIVEALAPEYDTVYLSCPVRTTPTAAEDHHLPDNVVLVPQPDWTSTLDSLKHIPAIRRSYRQAVGWADAVFIRGNPVAATGYLYRIIAEQNKPVCHWLVGNPVELLKSHKRSTRLKDALSGLYTRLWERALIHGRARANGSFLCNGQELADRYTSPKTRAIVSTTLTLEDFHWRDDTCQRDTVTLLCLCYIRPEKGIEYLIEALSNLDLERPFTLLLAGSRDRYPEYQSRLDALIEKFGLSDRVKWLGHVRHPEVHDLMVSADIFILPTLSEGTPRVLVEARSKGLPVISTRVGGIPTSVTHNRDGILVPPKNPQELARAIQRLASEDLFRKQIIKEGYVTVQTMTLNRFVHTVSECLQP